VPIRTFERAQKVDVICLRLAGEGAPAPLKQEECAPVPPRVNGVDLPNQLFALVTQTTRGEVAVVDLSAGMIIDQSQAVPGLNFLPVGAMPTDIATTPDGRMAFVASAEPNKFAIYGIPAHRILGDQRAFFGLPRDPEGAIKISSWPVCALPQRPGSLTVVPRPAAGPVTPGTDAGTTDAGPAPAGLVIDYELVAVLPGDRTNPAKIVTLDPLPFLRGSPRPGEDLGAGSVLTPGELLPCPITSAVDLVDDSVIPDSFRPGKPWDDGVKWVDGGVDLTCAGPAKPARCGLVPCKCLPPLPAPDGGSDEGDAGELPPADGGACEPGDAGPEPELALELGPLDPPQQVAIARDGQTLYVADDSIPIIHVIDLSTPGQPRELPPFVVSSIVEPSRAVSIRDIAISPPTREYKRYLYAVDRKDGSIAVFDVTDPVKADRTPMRRPHPELNPFQPPDRISFTAPVVAVAFARHDFPVTRVNGTPISNAKTGVLCNPNKNVVVSPNPVTDEEFGALYRADSRDLDVGLGPGRLRGIVAFATLSNGLIVAIDVDDWDAPCRRPEVLKAGADLGVLAVAQPEAPTGDLDPYHAPEVPPNSVSNELFFPVSAPHRPRSRFLLRDDPTTGRHAPFLPAPPSITVAGSVPPLSGPGSEKTPRMLPTAPATSDRAGVLFSYDLPDVHFEQDWTVTYEGALPGFEGLPATLSTVDGYSSLILSQPQARFCAKGVEDWAIGGERANAITNALAAEQRVPYRERLDRRMVDYVQVTDELLAANDPFWEQDDLPAPNACWDDRLNAGSPRDKARARFETCSNYFGSASAAQPDRHRDFPILEAYEDHLVVGRFHEFVEGSPEVVYIDPSNAPVMKLMRCCFHHQVKFKIRTGAQWLTHGSSVGVLSHVTRGDGGRCVPSCNPEEALLNARAPSLPFSSGKEPPSRNSPLAMRNPAFSFFVQNGSADTTPERDMAYHFSTRGGFQPLAINLAAQTTAVNPQSMRFIESLGQIAVVDAASQGLVLIDLAGVTIARAPYF
jgi:hypothetical protein